MPTIPFDGQPTFLSFHPAGRELYVSDWKSTRVWVLSTATWKVLHQFDVGRQPGKLRFSRDGRIAVVSNPSVRCT